MEQQTKRTIYSRIVSKSRNKTGLPGVMKRYNDYIALIKVRGKTHQIGVYATAKEAYHAYLKTARELGLKIIVRK